MRALQYTSGKLLVRDIFERGRSYVFGISVQWVTRIVNTQPGKPLMPIVSKEQNFWNTFLSIFKLAEKFANVQAGLRIKLQYIVMKTISRHFI